MLAIVTTPITARSGKVMGSGAVREAHVIHGEIVTGPAEDVPVRNYLPLDVPVGTLLRLSREDGTWVIPGVDVTFRGGEG